MAILLIMDSCALSICLIAVSSVGQSSKFEKGSVAWYKNNDHSWVH